MGNLTLSPYGLLLATILSLVNVFGGISKKKVVDQNELIAASFWIRFFAAVGFTVILVFATLHGSGPVLHTSAVIKRGQVRQVGLLAERLRHPGNGAVARIAAQLSAPTRDLVENFTAGRDEAQLGERLQQEWDERYLKNGALLYEAAAYDGVRLSAETRRLVDKDPHGGLAIYANRLLLEDLFPGNIVSSPGSDLFGVQNLLVPPAVAFTVYAVTLSVLIAGSQLLANYALQVSPISMSLPFMAFSPLFLMGTSYLVLHEMPTANKVMGVLLIFVGGVLMHRRRFAESWGAPLRALLKEPGSRYMLLAALIVSLTAPLEKKMLVISDWQTVGFYYGLGTVAIYGVLCRARRTELSGVLRRTPVWTIVAGLVDTGTVLLQFAAVTYLPVVIVICIKRTGIVLTILAGWMIFKEKQVVDKLIASTAMVAGLFIFYLSIETRHALLLSALVAVVLLLLLYATRRRPAESAGTGQASLQASQSNG